MRILHAVETYLPETCGMSEVVRQISERLVRAGHDVTVATGTSPARTRDVIGGVRVVSFPIRGNAVRGIEGPTEDYERFLLGGGFDIMTNFAAQQWATDLALPLLPRITARKVFVPTGFSALHDTAYAAYFERMKTWLHQYDMNVFSSGRYRDIDFARSCGVTNTMVIPNGAAEDEFLPPSPVDIRRKLGIPPGGLFVLHVGSHTSLKGHPETIRIFARAQLRRAALVIIGQPGPCLRICRCRQILFRTDPRRLLDGNRVVLAGLSRQETVAALQQADLFLFPSNVECSPIVLHECLASKTPFLSTDVGNAREIIELSGGGVLLPTCELPNGYFAAELDSSARLLRELAHDPARRSRLAESGFTAWRQRFTWEHIARQYGDLYGRLLAGVRPGGRDG